MEVQMLEEADVIIAESEAKSATFVLKIEDRLANTGVVTFSDESRCYTIIYSSDISTDDYLDEYEALIESIRFVKKQ